MTYRNLYWFQTLTSIDFKTVFDAPELKALGEGRLSISIRLKNQPEEAQIIGSLAPKFSCDLFDCVLAPYDLSNNNNQGGASGNGQISGAIIENNDSNGLIESRSSAPLHAMRGLAWMSMHTSGSIKYQMR